MKTNWTAGQGGGWHLTEDYYSLSTWLPNTGWADAPLAADGSVPYVHMVDTEGADYYVTNPLLGPEPWRYDFPQEVGSLEAVNPSDANKWENKSGTASWVLHAGELSVAGNNASLMVLTGTATEEVPGAGTIAYGANVSGPEITNTGDQEDTNYLAALVMQDGTDKKSTMTTDRPLASVGNSPGQYKLTTWTHYPALMDTNRARLNLGVGEEVDLYGMPGNMVWTGPGLLATNSAVTFTAPSNAPVGGLTATVIATVGNASLAVPFTVFPPSGIDHADIASTNHYSIGQAAAGMHLNIYIAPTTVSFYRVSIMEVGEDGTNISGYFTYWTPQELHHITADHWTALNENNEMTDEAFGGPFTVLPWSSGGFTWIIPASWQITGSGTTNSMAGWNQIFLIDNSGTVTVEKNNHSVMRTTNDVITTN